MNRSIQPEIKEIETVAVQQAEVESLTEGVKMAVLNVEGQDLMKIEVVFQGGSRYQDKSLQASMVNTMIFDGTEKMSGEEINELLDFYGAFTNNEVSKDVSSVQLYVASKHLDKVLPVFVDCLFHSTFPEKEFERTLSNKKTEFLVDSEKVDFICRQEFAKRLFSGGDYGGAAVLSDFDQLKHGDVFDFYKNYYQTAEYEILVSGCIPSESLDLIRSTFLKEGGRAKVSKSFNHGSFEPGEVVIPKEGASQSAIRIGRPIFNMNHEDYVPLSILNTILGGYFGSRLMSNIREDKGYTYGIGSGLIPYREGGVFLIASEVGVDVCKDAIREIYFELKRLREELIPQEELELVKNYLLGSTLRGMKNPFDIMDRYKDASHNDKGYGFFDYFIQTVNTITSEDLRNLAKRYLNEQDFLEMVVGAK